MIQNSGTKANNVKNPVNASMTILDSLRRRFPASDRMRPRSAPEVNVGLEVVMRAPAWESGEPRARPGTER
jgi:hypothetical protein